MKLVMQVREGVQIFFWGGDFSQMWVGGMHSGLKWGSGGGYPKSGPKLNFNGSGAS